MSSKSPTPSLNKFLHGLALIRRSEPWEHLFFPRVFTTQVYEEMLSELPPIEQFYTLDSYKEFRKVWALSNAKPGTYWNDVNNVFTSEVFKQTLAEVLKITKPFHPKPALIYDLPGYSIAPHRDASFKVATMIAYLPKDNEQKMLGTHLLKHSGASLSFRKQIGFFPNTGVAFAPGKESWHDVPKTPEGSGVRRTLHICCFDTPERDFK